LLPLIALSLVPALLTAGEPPRSPWSSFAYPAVFEHIGKAQGLSHATVYCTLQDSRGFLWFGTENGLDRYDGFGYKQFHYDKNQIETLGADWITSLLEDRQGQLWIGTNGGGLNRMDRDSRKFKRYLSDLPGGVPMNNVTALAEDADGNLWIGTYGKGLFMLPKKSAPPAEPQFRVFEPAAENPSALPGGVVTSLFADEEGELWIGLRDGGLCRLRRGAAPGGYAFERFTADKDGGDFSAPPDVLTIGEDAGGMLWIGGEHGLYGYDRASKTFHRYIHRDKDSAGLGFDLVRKVYRDRGDGMWIGTDGGGLDKMLSRAKAGDPPRFRHFVHDNKDPSSLASNAVESIFEDRSNVLWVGSYFMGLNKLVLNGGRSDEREKRPFVQYKNNPSIPSSLGGNMVNGMAEDRFGNLWIGTDGYGLDRVIRPADSSRPLAFEHFRADEKIRGSLPEDVVTGLFNDTRGQLWMTTFTQGLVRVDVGSPAGAPAFVQFRKEAGNPASLSDNFLWTFYEDRSHRLWTAGEIGSLELLDPRTSTFRHFWRQGSNVHDTLSAPVFAIAEDGYGMLWLATQNGLARFNPETRTFKSFFQAESPDGLSDSYVTALHMDGKGRLWAGTNSGGLNRIEVPPWDGPEPRFARFGVKEGLPDNSIMGILEDGKGQLWVSTSQTIFRFDPDSNVVHPFIWHEEIPRTSFIRNAVFRGGSGDLFFGGSNGFGLFRPGGIAYNDYIGPVYITDFRVLNKTIPLGERGSLADGITLSAKDYAFSFEFATMHFVAPQQNQYAYTLEGLDRDWNYSRNSHLIAYTTLPAGDYTLKVKASNCDGVWGDEGLKLKIRVLPPWWNTWWFRALAIALAAGAVTAAVRLRLRAMRKRNELLEEMVAEKTQEMKDILDNIEQGLFTVDLEGKVNPDFAASTNGILRVDNVASHSVGDLFRMDETQRRAWGTWLEVVRKEHASMKWKKLARLAPVQLLSLQEPNGTRFVQVGYQKMFDRQKHFRKLMILAQDVTESKRNEKRMEEENKRHEAKVKAILGIVKNSRTIAEFLEDLEARLRSIVELMGAAAPGKPVAADKLSAMVKEAHTIKGTSGSLGFEALAQAAHEAETILAGFRGSNREVTPEESARLSGCLGPMAEAMEELRGLAALLIGYGGSPLAAVPLERIGEIRDLCDAVGDGSGKEGVEALARLKKLCRSIDYAPLAELAENYGRMLDRIGSRLGKKVSFRAVPGDLEISPKLFLELNEPLIHLLRNAVDHGLETEAERMRLGKPVPGTIELKLEIGDGKLVVSVSDDGAGIDAAKVIRKAVALGVVTAEQAAAMDEKEKAALIFSEGLSTRDRVDEISGRGVGMEAAAAWAKREGGRIEVESQPGRGTLIRMIIPTA
jgi:ligand-binding sensor domain-containing protein/HPt (histidine-containing phosphotransfer) domain-containing protein